jgi:HK97 gp10 family phage protein
MSAPVSFKVDGLDEVMDSLKELSLTVQNRLVRQAAESAMQPVVDEARDRCPADTGNLAESIGVKRIRLRGRYKKGLIVISVGPRQGHEWARVGESKENKPFKYGVPVEYGHVAPGGRFVPPVAFMRQTYHNQKESIIDRFTSDLKQLVESATAKAARKANAV